MSSNHSHHDDKAHDQAFFRTFGMVLAALFGIFGFCIFAASLIVPKPGPTAADQARLEARIKPIGQAITDPAELAKLSAPKVKREPMTAEQVLSGSCAACHQAGVLGAPKTGDKADWGKRLAAAGGFDGLVGHAINGKNQMPARGGNPDLSDDEMKAAVKLMLEKSGL